MVDLLPAPDSLPVPPATDRGVWDASRLDRPTLDAIAGQAAQERTRPWGTPLASGFARYFRDGDRDAYEQVLWEREYRTTRAAIMAAATLDPAWIDETADGVVLLCEQSTWCWPAHDDTFTRHGSVLPTVTDPYLDLGAGELAMQLTWIDHLLGAPFDDRLPGLRERIRHEVDRRVLTPFEERRDWHWLGLDGHLHNWSPWIHGNVLVAALRLTDGARRDHLVRLIIDGLDRYAASIPADGAIDEGYSYWWNGACRLLEAFHLLAYASRGALGDATRWPALRATVSFPHRMHLGGDWYLNFADGPARPWRSQPWDALHRVARLFGDREAERHAAAYRTPAGPAADVAQGIGRFAQAITDPSWLTAAPDSPSPDPAPHDPASHDPASHDPASHDPASQDSASQDSAARDSAAQDSAARDRGSADGGRGGAARVDWFASTQVFVARGERLTLAFKGGHNDENHNHNDVGGVVVALGGVPVLVDPGRPTYTRQTFSADRYQIWTMRSSWHNTPTIGGVEQSAGRRFAARDVEVGDDFVSAELATAYAIESPQSWRRTARLADDVVLISDAWEPAKIDAGATVIHYVAAGSVSVGDGYAEIVALEGAGSVIMTWEPAVPCAVVVRELDDPMLGDVWGERLTRLDLDVTAVGRLDVTVKEQR
jgi:hypothetical protein